ncbi:MAG: glutamyl-tRNA reductase [Negativicutes bacterium]|nr:glutamyl-tRNA reductase [Negativicutes bacterium]
MPLVVLGLNHKTAPVAVRECFSFSEEQIRQGLKHLDEYDGILECVILSTCNRTEMYAAVDDPDEALPVLEAFFGRMSADSGAIGEYLFYFAEEACIRHLFRVASSLDSLIVGEGQILSQVKKAYSLARDTGTTGTVLNTLFNRAIAVGKKVRTKTRIAYNAVSISYAAVELAKKVFGDLSCSNVLVLGAGEMSELTARHLVDNGVKTVFVSNRNFSRATELADKFRGVAVPFEDFLKCAVGADIVITSTGAPHYIIRAWDVAHLMPKRNGRPIIFIDIAVPRDVEPEVEAIAGVQLFNIDALEAVVESNMKERAQEAAVAEELIETELEEILTRFRYLAFRPTLASLTDKAERIRQRELKRALNKLPDVTPEERRVMENMSRMLVRKLLRDPILNINEAIGTGKEHYYLDAVCQLFKLEEIGEIERREEKTCRRYARQ